MRKAFLKWLMVGLLICAAPMTMAADHQGLVLETSSAGGYTYMQVEENGESYWIAGPSTNIPKGTKVQFSEQIWMDNFTSKALGKTFDRLLFVSSIQVANAANAANASNAAQPAAVLPASELYTVEQVFAQKAELKGKVIAVKGKVAKVSTNIMHRTWVHIQDGTGGEGTNNLVFRSEKGTAKVGATITAQGTVDTERDFGMGYYYPVLIEDSIFSP